MSKIDGKYFAKDGTQCANFATMIEVNDRIERELRERREHIIEDTFHAADTQRKFDQECKDEDEDREPSTGLSMDDL